MGEGEGFRRRRDERQARAATPVGGTRYLPLAPFGAPPPFLDGRLSLSLAWW